MASELSSLILNDDEFKWLSEMTQFTSDTLLYRATRDGFNSLAFHSKCDGKSNTVTIVKTDSNCVFGGFTSAAWKSAGSCAVAYIKDTNAFVFSLRREGFSKSEKFLINPIVSKYAIFGHRSFGPVFGNYGTTCMFY